MSLLDRGPDGKFLRWGGALEAWIPLLLAACFSPSLALIELMGILMKWCNHRAAGEYTLASESLTVWERDGERYAKARSVDADKWFQRKAILAEAKAKLEAL